MGRRNITLAGGVVLMVDIIVMLQHIISDKALWECASPVLVLPLEN